MASDFSGRPLFWRSLERDKVRAMSDERTSPDPAALRKWLHDANNRIGVILASAELLQLDHLSARSVERCLTIESASLEVREILRAMSEHYLS